MKVIALVLCGMLICGCSVIPGSKHVVLVCPDGKSTVSGDVLPFLGATTLYCKASMDGGVEVGTNADISKPLAMLQAVALAVIAGLGAL